MSPQNKITTPLRQRMIEEMTMRKLMPKTQSQYLRALKKLTQFLQRASHSYLFYPLNHISMSRVYFLFYLRPTVKTAALHP